MSASLGRDASVTRRVPTGLADTPAGQALAALEAGGFEHVEHLYVVDADGVLIGRVELSDLFDAQPGTALRALMRAPLPAHASWSQERIASHALRHALTAVALTDARGRLVGVVPPRTLLRALRREHVEDLHRLAGIRAESSQAREAIEAPPARRARDRLPWLLLGLLGSVIATSIVANYEAALSSRVALAFFIPGIVYLADAIGTQTEAIAVRGLSLSHVPLRTLIAGEMRTGVLIGLTLGAVCFPLIWLVFGDARLGAVVALSLVAAGTVATTLGLLFPWLLAHLGRDPAYGSGPIATIVQDVMSLLIYFAIAHAMLAAS
ncbi:MAG: magnesium transporter [Burkholderiales bacterium]|nr:magnesium transporter [Burkholderiales bacterium]